MSSCEIIMLTCEIIISTCETQEASPLQASSPIESFAHGLSLLDQRDPPLLSFTPFFFNNGKLYSRQCYGLKTA